MLTEELPDSEFNVLGSFWNQNLKGNSITEEEVALWEKEGVINYLGEAEDVRDHIGETDCLVLPSYREGLSNVLLEASSMEKPCIASDTVGCREIVEDGITGFHCIVQNASDLSEKMKIMCRLPEEERRSMGQKARQKVAREYGKKIVIDAYFRVIDEIIKSKDHQGEAGLT
jgi:glycosyltransferase involved in cell wall biosynthesis